MRENRKGRGERKHRIATSLLTYKPSPPNPAGRNRAVHSRNRSTTVPCDQEPRHGRRPGGYEFSEA
jgi:hypothetical protein